MAKFKINSENFNFFRCINGSLEKWPKNIKPEQFNKIQQIDEKG